MRIVVTSALVLALSQAAAAQDAARGAELFQGYCAACHGASATGDGPMRAVLSVDPPDLTRLAARNGGTFPEAEVVRSIDGRDVILSHGGPMPLFGNILRDESAVVDAEDGTPVITRAAVVDIAAWLASIQEE